MRTRRILLLLWVLVCFTRVPGAFQNSKKSYRKKRYVVEIRNRQEALDHILSSKHLPNGKTASPTERDGKNKRYLIEVQDRQQAVKLANPIVDLEDSVRRGINDPLSDPRFVMNRINDDFFGSRLSDQGQPHSTELTNYRSKDRFASPILGVNARMMNQLTPSAPRQQQAIKEQVVPKHPPGLMTLQDLGLPQAPSQLSAMRMPVRNPQQLSDLGMQSAHPIPEISLQRQPDIALPGQLTSVIQSLNIARQPSELQGLNIARQTSELQALNIPRQTSELQGLNIARQPSELQALNIPRQTSELQGLNLNIPRQSSDLQGLNIPRQSSELQGLNIPRQSSELQGLNIPRQQASVLPMNIPSQQTSVLPAISLRRQQPSELSLSAESGINIPRQQPSTMVSGLSLPSRPYPQLQESLLSPMNLHPQPSPTMQEITPSSQMPDMLSPQQLPPPPSMASLPIQSHQQRQLSPQRQHNVQAQSRSPSVTDMELVEPVKRQHNTALKRPQTHNVNINSLSHAKQNQAKLPVEPIRSHRKMLNIGRTSSSNEKHLLSQKHINMQSNNIKTQRIRGKYRQSQQQQQHKQQQHQQQQQLDSINALTGLPEDLEEQSFGAGVSSVTAITDPVQPPSTVTVNTGEEDTSIADTAAKAEEKASEAEIKATEGTHDGAAEDATTSLEGGGGLGGNVGDDNFSSLKDYLEADNILRDKLGKDGLETGGGGDMPKNNPFSDSELTSDKAINIGGVDNYEGDKSTDVTGAKRSLYFGGMRRG